jgi:hypothetical protein
MKDLKSTEFYRNFSPLFGQTVMNLVNKNKGKLGPSKRTVFITFLCKKPDGSEKLTTACKPISLLNCDYNIISLVIPNRIQKALSKLLHANHA